MWPDTFVQEETLTQNISTIRRALGDSPELPRFVLTIPREGYRFIAPVEITEVHLPSDAPPHHSVPSGEHPAPRPVASAQRRSLVHYLAGASTALLLAAIASIIYLMRSSPPSNATSVPSRMEFEVFEPPGTRFSTSGGLLSMSPDGRYLVFIATDADGTDHLWLRPLDSRESVPLPGTADASQPFWSPDSKSIAYFADRALRTIDVSGGSSRTVCSLPRPQALAGSWGANGKILFAVNGRGLFQVDASGGTPTPVTVPDMGLCEECLWPSFLPDGRRFLLTVVSATSRRGIYVASLDGSNPRRVVDAESSATYTQTGYLLHASAGALVARRFVPADEEIGAEELPVADRIWVNPGTRRAVFSVSQNGIIAYREPQRSRLQWIARSGASIAAGPDGVFHSFNVAHDGRVVASQLDPLAGTYDMWLYDAALKAPRRLTFDAASDFRPIWSKDDSSAVFAREGPEGWQLYEVKVDGPGVERPLLREPSRSVAAAVSWDGVLLEYSTFGRSEPSRLWSVRPDGRDGPLMLEENHANEREGRRSPDGKLLAFTTNLTDSRVPNGALLLRPWPGAPGRTEIAPAGSAPQWRSDGRELFFIQPNGRLMAQRISDGRAIGEPEPLCTTDALPTSGLAGQAYEAAPDGQRFLVKVPARPASIIVRSGWGPTSER